MENIVRQNLLQIQEEIAPCKPNIIAVTKYFDGQAIVCAYNAGLRDFAEARVNDAIEKIEALPAEVRENSTFHFIGHLQTNKVAKVVKYFDYIHSVDSLHLAEKISLEAAKLGKVQKIFLEVNFAEEEQKFGFSKLGLEAEFEQIVKLENLDIQGLMSMSPLGAEQKFLSELFSEVKGVQESLAKKYGLQMKETSMGMSQDYMVAVKCGATKLRIGRKLFT
ncbi:MAG: YggS family pyridoxal phosphate-dependent enzyme [Fusobacterium sp.]|nr:YggS family pyridoxal phosphate-dependent enzyme [Fusobacterium sp.]